MTLYIFLNSFVLLSGVSVSSKRKVNFHVLDDYYLNISLFFLLLLISLLPKILIELLLCLKDRLN